MLTPNDLRALIASEYEKTFDTDRVSLMNSVMFSCRMLIKHGSDHEVVICNTSNRAVIDSVLSELSKSGWKARYHTNDHAIVISLC